MSEDLEWKTSSRVCLETCICTQSSYRAEGIQGLDHLLQASD